MVKMWLLRSVVFFAFLCATSLLNSETTFARGESYRWTSYNHIEAMGGSFAQLAPSEGGAAVATFVQVKDQPTIFRAEKISDNCPGALILTFATNPTQAQLSIDGDCPSFTQYDPSVTIATLGVGVQAVDSEAATLANLHKDVACTEEVGKEACLTAAAVTFKDETNRCLAQHNYQKNVIYGDSYLDCLATALGVQRPDLDAEAESKKKYENSCQIPEIGWVICQLTEHLATLADASFQLLRPFLELEPLTQEIGLRPGHSTTYTAWQTLRDIANILLVIGFFIVIFSYLSGVGINTYNIKKSLPRFVVCAVLINISFYVCGAMIDLSNIFGRSLQAMTKEFSDVAPSQSTVYKDWLSTTRRINSITPTDTDFTKETTAGMSDNELRARNLPVADPNDSQAGGAQGSVTVSEATDEATPTPTVMMVNGAMLTGGLVLYANLAVLLPVMVVSLFAMFVTLLVLLFRQALVIVLVVVSPLAMAAYILPGTKSWFDKWKSTLTQLLLLYPIIALLFAASSLASQFMMESAQNNGQTILALLSMGILVIPLLVTPLVLKFGGGVLAQFAGKVQGAMSTPRSKLLGSANEFRKDRKTLQRSRAANGRRLFGLFNTNNKYLGKVKSLKTLNNLRPTNLRSAVAAGSKAREDRLEKARQLYFSENAERLASGVKDKDALDSILDEQLSGMREVRLEKVEAMEAVWTQAGRSQDDYLAMGRSGRDGTRVLDEIERQTAIRLALKEGTTKSVHTLMESMGSMDSEQRIELTSSAKANGILKNAPHLGAGVMNRVRDGDPEMSNVNKVIADAANSHKFSGGAAIANLDEDTIDRLNTVMQGGQVTPQAAAQIRQAIRDEINSNRSVKHKDRLLRL